MKKLLELEMKYPKEIKMPQPLKFVLKPLLLCLFFAGISTSLEAAPLASSFSEIAFNTVNTLDNTQVAEIIPNASFSIESFGERNPWNAIFDWYFIFILGQQTGHKLENGRDWAWHPDCIGNRNFKSASSTKRI